MCGIAGFISLNTNNVTIGRLKNMTDIINHRGPDGEGQWISENGIVGFGHRRLSILDLSEHANQPMHYLGRYTIVFNGEIYNYVELKEQLLKQGYSFRTTSDTEVLMALFDRDKENCLQHLDGMFSFAIFDAKENTVFCARDRFGEKPFFFSYEKGKSFVFGSELKVLWAAGIKKVSNNKMLYKYLTYGQIENPEDQTETFYENCTRLPQGHFLKISLSDLTIEIKKYYDIDWQNINYSITEKDAVEQFRSLFYTSTKRRLRSDVPVGSSLSGGLDSSLVVTVIDELIQGTGQIQKTFSAIFPGYAKDESRFMKMVIDKTNVEPFFVTPDDAGMIANLNKLSYHQEEPYGSSSVYVQFCVMQLAKENGVTVLLDGQGADEILAGYHSYFPVFFKELENAGSPGYKEELSRYKTLQEDMEKVHRTNSGMANMVNKISPDLLNFLRKYYHSYKKSKTPDFYSKDFKAVYQTTNTTGDSSLSLNEALYKSTMKRGLHELLRYADRNSMAHSREVRLPFLSSELVDFLFTLPANFKIRDAWTKWIMRQSFSDLL